MTPEALLLCNLALAFYLVGAIWAHEWTSSDRGGSLVRSHPRPETRSQAVSRLTPRLFLFGVCIVASVLAAQTTGQPPVSISGKVTGASGRKPVHIALWNAQGFLARPVQEIRIAPGAAMVFRFQVQPGRWAVSAFEDENGNGVLDMGAFGPKEPSGFWRPFHAWRKPRFDDVAVQVDHDLSDAEIRLGK